MTSIINSSEAAHIFIAERTSLLAKLFKEQGLTHGVIAVSGGIDSAVSLSLLTQAIGAENVTVLLLPYKDQDMSDAVAAAEWAQIPQTQILTIQITAVVNAAIQELEKLGEVESFRIGNIQARARMIMVYDTAKRLQALVCGTENKSEHYLGYFTRFGDAASDIEPIATIFKTEVRKIAETLGVPEIIQTKAPSAGLWAGQTDETELGFSYEEADVVMAALEERGHLHFTTGLDLNLSSAATENFQVESATLSKILDRLYTSKFKLHVPYILGME